MGACVPRRVEQRDPLQSSTFGPTDAPLLARWAKLLSVVQISIALSIVILLIARAVGVL